MKLVMLLIVCLVLGPWITSQEELDFRPLYGDVPKTRDMGFHRHARQSGNESFQDNHTYYQANFFSADTSKFDELWVDLSKNTSHHVSLSDSYRTFIKIPFQLPFYGHTLSSVAITTSGFISTYDVYHRFLQLTQYIAPFSADFNPSQNSESRIYYQADSDRLIVQWDNMTLHNRENLGQFSFEAIVLRNGTIYFLYEDIPVLLNETRSPTYVSLIGVADAYIVEFLRGSMPIRIVYNYHRVFLGEGIRLSGAVYQLDPLPNCVTGESFEECRNLSCYTNFDCGWCNAVGRCSDGIDRHRQSWIDNGCNEMDSLTCNSTPPPSVNGPFSEFTKPQLIGLLVGLVLFLILSIMLTIFVIFGSMFVMRRNFYKPKQTVERYDQMSM